MRSLSFSGLVVLSAVSVACALGIIFGEVTSRWYFGGALIGVLLLCYSFIILFLRKLGLIGPRKAER